MLYLDNAATSFPKPPAILKEVKQCVSEYCANPGRGSHHLALRSAEEIYLTRESVSKLFSLESPENVVFTLNATYALNIAIKSVLTENCHVITSDMEHNAVLRPLYSLSKKSGLRYSVFSTSDDIEKSIEALICHDTKAIISTLASNVTGKTVSLEKLNKIAKKHNLILILDASQLVGHEIIELKNCRQAILCAPGHKGLFGMQGCGFAVFKDISPLSTLIEGGTGYGSAQLEMPLYLPEHFEAGTLPTPSIVSLRRGIEFINSYGIKNISDKIRDTTDCFTERLASIRNVRMFGGENGIISFLIEGVSVEAVAARLKSYDICAREGLHCAPLAHKTLGTDKTGLIRISLSIFNQKKDADILYEALRPAFV